MEKKRMRIRADYILDRHGASAEDENGNGPASKLCDRAEKAEAWVSVLDSELNLIDELVSGAWLYEGMSREYNNDSEIKSYERQAKKIVDRWESGFYSRNQYKKA